MKKQADTPGVRWWEHVWYLMVLVFFGLVALFFLLVDIFRGRLGTMSRWKSYTITLAVLIILAGSWVAFSYYGTNDLGQRTVEIIVEPGDSFGTITRNLVDREVIGSTHIFRLAGRLRGVDRILTPGKYSFVGENSCRSVLDRLRDADFVRLRLTVPEGLPIWKVAALVAQAMELDSAAFQNLNHDTAFLKAVDLPSLEGYLFPETYFLQWGLAEQDVAREMIAMFRQKTNGIWPSSHVTGLNQNQIVALASIIEAETKIGSEREVVSSVYCNRLRDDMKLDADPTVIYGLGGLDRPLWRRDLKQDTPYNTYMHKGLPPTPINSPGLAALRAACDPSETEYYFFVADRSGGHRFSRTNAEHNRARREIEAQKP